MATITVLAGLDGVAWHRRYAVAYMSSLLGLLTAVAFGSSDFVAGLLGRTISAARVALAVQVIALIVAGGYLCFWPQNGPTWNMLPWALMIGVGSAGGPMMLYRGMARGAMSVVAPLSAVTSAALPALLGIFLGDQLSTAAYVGLAAAIPAIALVSWQPAANRKHAHASGLFSGIFSGVGFALLFIGLHQAAHATAVWALLVGLTLASLLMIPLARSGPSVVRYATRNVLMLLLAAGLADGVGNLLFIGASTAGALSITAVLAALYPAITLILARVILNERWHSIQIVGLVIAAAAVGLIAV